MQHSKTILLLVTLFPITVFGTCPLPLSVDPKDFPSPWVPAGPIPQGTDAIGPLIKCKKVYVGQLAAGAKTFTSGSTFRCNATTRKWTANGYEAPPYMSCGVLGYGTQVLCSVNNKQGDTQANIAIYPGNEMYCPSGQQLIYANGTGIRSISCSAAGLKIVSENGTDQTYVKATTPELMCKKVLAKCPLPKEVPTRQYPSPWIRGGDLVKSTSGGYDWIDCPSGYVGQLGTGSKSFTFGQAYRCDPASGKWIHSGDNYEAPEFLSCGAVPDGAPITYCEIYNQQANGASGSISLYPGGEQYCREGEIVQYGDGKAIRDIKCSATGLRIEDEYGTISTARNPTLKCVPGTCRLVQVCSSPTVTTTSTISPTRTTTRTTTRATSSTATTSRTASTTTAAATTTTVKADTPPTSDQLWDVMYYYNYWRVLHAFCADQACINVIQSNGIGYDMVNYKGVVGRAIREDAITAVRAACPTGSANLRNLGFSRSGLKQGWVAIANGACGATQPIKRWKCHQSEDMMYATNLEGNTFYQGLVQDGGKVQFWMY